MHAQQFFQHCLAKHQPSLDYLKGRGFTDESIIKFGFGYAPVHKQQGPSRLLSERLEKLGFTHDQLVETSISWRGKRGGVFDFYHHRIMIPIHDRQGHIVGFGGRAFGDDMPKYLNSRESVLFNKSALLYGLDKAFEAIRKKRRVIVVEGYMDTLQLWQHGFDEAVACLGTALTSQHMRILANITTEVYLIFDSDAAGVKAALRSLDVALQYPSIHVRVVNLKDAKDPDEFVKRPGGAKALETLITQAEPLLEFALTHVIRNTEGLSVLDVMERQLIPWLRTLKDPLQKGFLLAKISAISGVEQQLLQKLIKEAPDTKTESILTAPATSAPMLIGNITQLDKELLSHLIFTEPTPQLVDLFCVSAKSMLEIPGWGALVQWCLDLLKENKKPFDHLNDILQDQFHPEVMRFIESIAAHISAFSCSNREEKVSKIISLKRLTDIKNKIQHLKAAMRQLSPKTPEDIADTKQILTTIQGLTKELVAIERFHAEQ
jgi:DNA primase